jgi:hypothetical protein
MTTTDESNIRGWHCAHPYRMMWRIFLNDTAKDPSFDILLIDHRHHFIPYSYHGAMGNG